MRKRKEVCKMTNRSSSVNSTYRLTVYGMMTALAFAANYIRFPFLGSYITVSNTLCVLCGYILGPWAGFVTAGMGNFLYDLLTGYGIEGLVTLVSKGAVALVAGLISYKTLREPKLAAKDRMMLFISAGAGALTYVALYMLKTLVFGLTVNGLDLNSTLVKMGSKLPASLINAVFATAAAPVMMNALHIPLHKLGVFRKG